MLTRLILVRHAEAEGNFERIFHGWMDGDVTQKGHKQAQLMAKQVCEESIDIIYSSDLKRTRKTANYIAKQKELEIIEDKRLREIYGGDWEGKLWNELPEKWPDEFATWENKPHLHQMPNGESMWEFSQRIVSAVTDIVERNSGENICIVTHGTAIKVLLCYFYEYELEKMSIIKWCDNTAITIIDFEDNGIKVIVEGYDEHLGNDNATIKNQDWWESDIEKLNKYKSLE